MAAPVAVECYRFGRFELQPGQRRLLSEGRQLPIGGRALDLLIALVERSGNLVGKDELFARVWPKLVVEENSLHAQMSTLRKVLGPGAIETVSGWGYRFVLDVAGETTSAPAAPPRPNRSGNLPAPVTSFVGREKELADLEELLHDARLVTLTGSGGCGKTRLAARLAARAAPNYADGAWMVEIATLSDPWLLPQAVAVVLGVQAASGLPVEEALVERMRDREMLLVLDNCEHLVADCATLAERLLATCPHLTLLATSRERLAIAGETTYRVPSLSVPPPGSEESPDVVAGYDAVRLFVDRARLQEPTFVLTARSAPTIKSICRRLDGIPLAVELAAARVRSMTVDEIGARLDRRFELLKGASRTALPRHRTLRSLIDWSHDLLLAPEQVLLRELAVFSGGWSLEAAEAVSSDADGSRPPVLDVLTSLVDKSLVVAGGREGSTRYDFLETVRHYARERLQEAGGATGTERRHLAHFVALAERAEEQLRGADQLAWFDLLELEHDNLRAALSCSMTSQAQAAVGLRLAGAVWWFWHVRGYASEGRDWLSRLLDTAGDVVDAATQAKALRAAAGLAVGQNDLVAARLLIEQSLACAAELQDPMLLARSLTTRGSVCYALNDLAAARAAYTESLAIFRTVDNQPGAAAALTGLGVVALGDDDLPAARTFFEDSLPIQRMLADPIAVAMTLANLGLLLMKMDDLTAARACVEEAVTLYRKFGDDANTAQSLANLARIASGQRDFRAAHALYRESICMLRDLGPGKLGLVAQTLMYLAQSRTAAQAWSDAARLIGHAERYGDDSRWVWDPEDRRVFDDVRATTRASMKAGAFDAACDEGRAMTLDEALRLQEPGPR